MTTGERGAPRSRPAPAEPAREPHPSGTPGPDMVRLGEFGRPHGLNGEVRLKSYTADPLAIAGYGVLTTGDGRAMRLQSVRAAPGGAADLLVARVEGVRDRNASEALNRVALFCPRERLGTVEDEEEVFVADLVGAEAVDAAGVVIGRVIAVPNFGGGDLLEIRSNVGGPSALLPFTKAFVPELDLVARRIVVAPPEDLFAPPGPRPAEDRG